MTLDQLAPSVFTAQLSRMDSVTSNQPTAFNVDCAYFREHKGQRSYIRRQTLHEFDAPIDATQLHTLPLLHVLVVQLAEDWHLITPIWRGHAFWYERLFVNDVETASIVEACAARGGMNVAEVIRWAETHDKGFDASQFLFLQGNKTAMN